MRDADVLVVGAGPVGLTAALALVRGGMRVDLVESRLALESESLAATFHPPTLQILADLGLELHGHGLEARTIGYLDAVAGDETRFELAELAGETAFHTVATSRRSMCRLLLAELADDPRCRISFGVTASGGVTGNYPGLRRRRGEQWIALGGGPGLPGHGLRGHRGPPDLRTAGFRGLGSGDIRRLGPPVGERPASARSRPGDRPHRRGTTDPESVAVDAANLVLGMSPRLRGWSCYRSQRRVIETNVVDNLIFVGDSAHVTTTRGDEHERRDPRRRGHRHRAGPRSRQGRGGRGRPARGRARRVAAADPRDPGQPGVPGWTGSGRCVRMARLESNS